MLRLTTGNHEHWLNTRVKRLYLLGGWLGRAFRCRFRLRGRLSSLRCGLRFGLSCGCFRCGLYVGNECWDDQVIRKGLTFLVSFFALVVFFVDGFFAAAVFLLAAGAFFGAAAGFFVVAALFVVVLDLPRAVFFAGAALVASALPFLEGGWAFCERLNNPL